MHLQGKEEQVFLANKFFHGQEEEPLGGHIQTRKAGRQEKTGSLGQGERKSICQGESKQNFQNLNDHLTVQRIQQVSVKIANAIGIVQAKMGGTKARSFSLRSTQAPSTGKFYTASVVPL